MDTGEELAGESVLINEVSWFHGLKSLRLYYIVKPNTLINFRLKTSARQYSHIWSLFFSCYNPFQLTWNIAGKRETANLTTYLPT